MAQKTGELENLENLVHNQSLGSIIGAWPTPAPHNGEITQQGWYMRNYWALQASHSTDSFRVSWRGYERPGRGNGGWRHSSWFGYIHGSMRQGDKREGRVQYAFNLPGWLHLSCGAIVCMRSVLPSLISSNFLGRWTKLYYFKKWCVILKK